ncbi:hypothetical protein AMEX_G5972 [Astyanax mexicanus]|uniref:Uncharacterized protein n=1 Tax=Astyanax mexicanus TaxID=7994 RepID=A0A8T2M2C4_ASTMX|nr:hypothetical protein AMEX_G5972 [Astyanax mexicanus]
MLSYNRADPCDITLTCRVWDSIIICNHSNSASWKQENKTFTHLCADIDAVSPPAGGSVCLVKTGLYSIILITNHIRERRNKSSSSVIMVWSKKSV